MLGYPDNPWETCAYCGSVQPCDCEGPWDEDDNEALPPSPPDLILIDDEDIPW